MDPAKQNSNPIPERKTPIRDGNPYFMGDQALVGFSNGGGEPQEYWLVDKRDRTVRPFSSPLAMARVFGDRLPEAKQKAMIIAPPQIDEEGEIADGVLMDFTLLDPDYSIDEDGDAKEVEFSSYQLKRRYGKPINYEAEDLAVNAVDKFMGLLEQNSDRIDLPKDFLKSLKRNQRLMAFYVNALAYGDYTLGDIFADITQRRNAESE